MVYHEVVRLQLLVSLHDRLTGFIWGINPTVFGLTVFGLTVDRFKDLSCIKTRMMSVYTTSNPALEGLCVITRTASLVGGNAKPVC